MNIVLILIFASIAAVALAFACWPLWRSGGKGRGLLVASLALLMIAIAAGSYMFVGHPYLARRSLEKPSTQDARALVTKLAWRMRQNPNDPRGWFVLGRGYLFLHDAQDAAKPDPQKVQKLGEQIHWDTQVFADRNSMISYACFVPDEIEHRLFALAGTASNLLQ